MKIIGRQFYPCNYSKQFISFCSLCVLIMLIILVIASSSMAHMPHNNVRALAISPRYFHDRTVFLAVEKLFIKSMDGGASWQSIIRGIDNSHNFSYLAVAPSTGSNYSIFLGTEGDGVYRSDDSGTSWNKTNRGLNNLVIKSIYVSPDYEHDKTVLLVESQGELYRSVNGGENWSQVSMDNRKASSLVFSQSKRNKFILMGNQEGIVYISSDRGETFAEHSRISDCGSITSIAIAPDKASGAEYFIGTEKKGLFFTSDDGRSYEQAHIDLAMSVKTGNSLQPHREYITSIVLSPNYHEDSTLYVTTWYDAVYRSGDGGRTWQRLSKGLTITYQADTPGNNDPHFYALNISDGFMMDQFK